MSLILDALRKSERSRQQSLTGRLGAADAPPPASRMAVPWTTLLGLLLLINAVVLGVLFWPRGEPPAAPVTVAPAEAAQAYRPDVRPLSAEAVSGDDGVTPSPTDIPVAPASPPATPKATPMVAQNSSADIPAFDNLPADFRQTLPPLHLDVHGYAANPADRFVVINLQRYRIGDALPGGIRVVDIVPQGAVLESNGTRFLLPP